MAGAWAEKAGRGALSEAPGRPEIVTVSDAGRQQQVIMTALPLDHRQMREPAEAAPRPGS